MSSLSAIWVCPCHNPTSKLGFANWDQKCILALPRSLLILALLILILNLFFNFRIYTEVRFCLYLVGHSTGFLQWDHRWLSSHPIYVTWRLAEGVNQFNSIHWSKQPRVFRRLTSPLLWKYTSRFTHLCREKWVNLSLLRSPPSILWMTAIYFYCRIMMIQ